jgi:hypothetical protein
MLAPGSQTYETAPPAAWDSSAPTEIETQKGQGANPFRDDAEPLPTPAAGQGTKIGRPIALPHAAVTPRAGSPTAKKSAVVPPRPIASVSRATAVHAPAANRRPMLTTPTRPAALPLDGPKNTAAEPQPLKITVSSPIDSPVKHLAPIAAPPDVNTPAAQAVTLTSLERMIDVSASGDSLPTGPAVVRNDFARPAESRPPLRRKPLVPKDDPQLEKQTLSALESMLSSD